MRRIVEGGDEGRLTRIVVNHVQNVLHAEEGSARKKMRRRAGRRHGVQDREAGRGDPGRETEVSSHLRASPMREVEEEEPVAPRANEGHCALGKLAGELDLLCGAYAADDRFVFQERQRRLVRAQARLCVRPGAAFCGSGGGSPRLLFAPSAAATVGSRSVHSLASCYGNGARA